MEINHKEILKALSHVDDPDLKKDIVTLGMVRNVDFTEKSVGFDLVLTTPACPMKEMLEKACITAIQHFISKDLEVKVNVISEVKNSVFMQGALRNIKNVIAVASGKGGVGKSTVSVNLAQVLAQSGAKVGLLDADIYGPSQAILTNTQEFIPGAVPSEGRTDLMATASSFGLKIFSIGYLVKPTDPIVWRGPMLSSAIKQFVQDVDWGELDYLIIDLPPGTGDIQLTLSQAVSLSGVVIVTTPQELAVADARRALQMFKMPSLNIPVLGVIENMSWFQTPELPDKKFYLFGKGGGLLLSSESQVPFLGSIPMIENYSNTSSSELLPSSPAFKFFVEIAGSLVRSLAMNSSSNNNQTT